MKTNDRERSLAHAALRGGAGVDTLKREWVLALLDDFLDMERSQLADEIFNRLPDRSGEMNFAVSVNLEKKHVEVRFSKPTLWFGLTPAQVGGFTVALTHYANQIEADHGEEKKAEGAGPT